MNIQHRQHKQTFTRRLVILLAALCFWGTALQAQTTDPVTLTINQPDGSVETVTLSPGSQAFLNSDGNIVVDSESPLQCSEGCEVELDFFTATGGGQSANEGGSLTVTQGQNIVFDWSARGGWSCAASGLPGSATWENDALKSYRTFGGQNDGNVVSTDSVAVSATAYNATLTCSTSSGTSTSGSIAITIDEEDDTNPDPDPNPDFCSDRQSLSDFTTVDVERATDVLLANDAEDGTMFSSVFGMAFPAFSAPQKKFRLFDGFYASMQFQTPSNLSGAGTIFFNELVGTAGGDRIVAISPCEGDFNPLDLPQDCVQKLSGISSYRWTSSAQDNSAGCLLQPEQTYFLNIIYTDNNVGDWPVQYSCPFLSGTDRCGHSVTNNLDNIY
jgi:hypothetical protein